MKSKILMVLSIVFALFMINSGLNKFFNYMPMPEEMPAGVMVVMGAMMAFGWLMPLVATVEIIAGVLMIFGKTRLIGAIMILPIMVGILLTHAINMEGNGIAIPIVLFAIVAWVLIAGKDKIAGLLK